MLDYADITLPEGYQARFQEDIISIWNRSAGDQAVTNRIRDTFRRVLNLPPGTVTEYKAHNDSIK